MQGSFLHPHLSQITEQDFNADNTLIIISTIRNTTGHICQYDFVYLHIL